jgi:pimeloyl-ACP methyl ester carboxylesterase
MAVDNSFTGTTYSRVAVDGVDLFYRDAGPRNAPCILLLHGYPSSSRMFEPLFEMLSSRYHLIAPDYPRFGLSDAPPPGRFTYTFDHLADSMPDTLRSRIMRRRLLN